ncbi:MAG: EamA family transporter [Geminicoccaceae bacterium]
MTPLVFFVVLGAAIMHATWNALVKHGGDPFLRLAVVNLTGSLISAPFLFFIPPPVAAAWPWIAASIGIHILYCSSLCLAYRTGDLSQIYPVARGVAPPLVALLGFLVAGETPSGTGILALAMISGGILLIAFGRRAPDQSTHPLFLAAFCGASIATYTLCDGLGIRASTGTLDYIVWFFFLDGLPFGLSIFWLRRKRLSFELPPILLPAMAGGTLSFVAYGLVIWAMRSTPMAYVSGLRETSVILAAIIGTRLLGEPFGRERVTAACIVAGGIGLLKLVG